MYIYYRFIVRFPIGLDLLFITFTFLLHLLLSWTSSLSISSLAISASTLCKHVFLGLPAGLLPSTLYSIHFFTQSSSPFLITCPIPSHSTTSNESCDRLNSNQPSQFFSCYSVFQWDTTHLSNHLHLCSFKLQPESKGLTSISSAVCMFIVSKYFLISSATVIVRAEGDIWLNPFATVLFTVCSAVTVEYCVLYPWCAGAFGMFAVIYGRRLFSRVCNYWEEGYGPVWGALVCVFVGCWDGAMLANFHMWSIMLLLISVLSILVRNESPRGTMCFKCLIFSLSRSCELLFYCLWDLSCGECNVISLYVLWCSVNESVCCVSDNICEIFGDTIYNMFGSDCYFVVESYEVV